MAYCRYSATGGGGGSSTISIGETVTGGTTGSVLFVGPGPVLAQDNAHFFWDDTNNLLGVGTAAPSAEMHVVSGGPTIKGQIVQGAAAQSANLQEWQNSSGTILAKVIATGQIGTVNGGASLCGFHFNDQPSMGIYRTGGTSMSFSAGDAQKIISVSSDPVDYGLIIGEGISGAPLTDQFLRTTNGAGTDAHGSNLVLSGGRATGNAAGGTVVSQTSVAGSSGSSSQSYATRLTIDSTGTSVFTGGIQPAHLADSAAPNDTIYYSTTASKLVYKDSGGTVNPLY